MADTKTNEASTTSQEGVDNAQTQVQTTPATDAPKEDDTKIGRPEAAKMVLDLISLLNPRLYYAITKMGDSAKRQAIWQDIMRVYFQFGEDVIVDYITNIEV